MRYVSIDLSSDNYLEQPIMFGGYAGEHNETILQVRLPNRMIGIECSGYRFDFQTSEDNKISSPLIPVSELDNGIISFHLSEQLTIAGNLLFNVAAILSDESAVSLISKTNSVILHIANSPDGNSQLIDPNGCKDELLAMVDERFLQLEQNKIGRATTEGGEIFNDYREWASEADTEDGEGAGNIASGLYAHAENSFNQAAGKYSHAEGHGTQATNSNAHAEGRNTIASGHTSHAEGLNTHAEYTQAHAEGRDTVANGTYGAHAEGCKTWARGNHSHAQGLRTVAFGNSSFVSGASSISIPETSTNSIREALEEQGITKNSTSSEILEIWKLESNFNMALGQYSHTEGIDNLAYGKSSHAEGEKTLAQGNRSHTSGYNTKATKDNQFVVGQYNKENDEALFIVGNGEDVDNRGNAFEVLADGSATVQAQGVSDNSVVVMSTLNTKINKSTPRLINKITLSEDAELYSVDLDSDGKAFSVQPFYVVFNLMPDFETATTRSLSLRMTTDRYERFLCMSTVTFATDYVGVMGVLKAEIIGGITVSEVKKYTYKSSILAGKMSFSPDCAISNNRSNPIKSVDVYLYDNNARKKVTLKAGSTIELWGCDYENLS